MTEKKQPDNPDEDRLNIEDLAPKGDDLKGGRKRGDGDDCDANCRPLGNCVGAGCEGEQKRGGPKGTLRK